MDSTAKTDTHTILTADGLIMWSQPGCDVDAAFRAYAADCGLTDAQARECKAHKATERLANAPYDARWTVVDGVADLCDD